MNMDLIKEIGAHLKNIAPAALIRSGDYPREKGVINITVILSELGDVEKIRNYFTKTITLLSTMKKRQEGIEGKYKGIEGALTDIPSLL